MHTITIGGYNKKRPDAERVFDFPGSFQECTPEQLGTVLAITGLPMPETDDEDLVADVLAMRRVRLLFELCAMPAELQHQVKDASAFVFSVQDAQGEEHGEVLPQLDWAFGEAVWEKSVLPELVHKGTTWIGPGDAMENFSVKRWGYSDVCLSQLGGAGDGNALNNLLGCLYVPTGEQWNNQDVEARGERLADLPDVLKLAALANYRALRMALPKRYPNAFNQGGAQDPHGIHGLIVDLAGPKFGDTRTAETAPVNDVLIHVEKLKIAKVEAEDTIVVPEDFESNIR